MDPATMGVASGAAQGVTSTLGSLLLEKYRQKLALEQEQRAREAAIQDDIINKKTRAYDSLQSGTANALNQLMAAYSRGIK